MSFKEALPIPGYPGYYITKCGVIYSTRRVGKGDHIDDKPRALTPYKNPQRVLPIGGSMSLVENANVSKYTSWL